MLNLKNGDTISLQELKKQLGISQPTWQNRKDQIVEEMKDFYDFTIISAMGKTTTFKINEVYDENCQYSYKRKNGRRAEIAKQFLWNYVVKLVEQKELFSGASIARYFKSINCKELEDYSEQWIARQVGVIIKLNYQNKFSRNEGVIGSVVKRVLVTLDYETNTYIPLTESQQEFFYSHMSEKMNSEWCKETLNIIYCEDSPLSNEEKISLKGQILDFSWERASKAFRDKYGCRPLVIKTYSNNKEEVVLTDDLPDWFIQVVAKSQFANKIIKEKSNNEEI